VLPDGGIDRILVLRTAQLPEVQWVRRELARRYPHAKVGILGSRLAVLGAFEDHAQFEVADDWLTSTSMAPLLDRVEQFAPDLVVMCVNNDWRVGYEATSGFMGRLPCRHKVVALCNGGWDRWRHVDFVEGHPAVRWLIHVCGLAALAPAVAAYLLAKSARSPCTGTSRSRLRKETRA
jgi:hypothetical protein